MAELGHPVIGPQSYWKLTYPELRVYAEGMRVQNERERQAQRQAQGEPEPTDPNRPSHRRREAEMWERVKERAASDEASA